jgi:dihydroorotate dehydrogenase
VLVKLAPELSEADLAALLEFFESQAIDGLVLTNTLAGQTAIGPGGWSGGAVRERAAEVLRLAHTLTKLPIISVGGIDSPEIARDRLRRGASLVELYSGWIFKGPKLPSQIAATL